MKKFDLFVIGTGVSGTAIAQECVAKGLKVGITDQRPYGGTCAMRGCVPKKVLFGASEIVEAATRLKGKGIDNVPTIVWSDLVAFKQTFVEPVTDDKENRFREKGIATLHGTAKFVAPNQLQIGEEFIEADKIVIATGAKPRHLDINGQEYAFTSDDFLNLKELPCSMLFIGGGYITFEFAHIAARCGVNVTIVHKGKQPLENFEPEIVNHLVEATKMLGINMVLETEITEIVKSENGFSVIGLQNGKKRLAFDAELVFNSAGRVPAISDLDLGKANIEFTKKGVEVNEFLQSVSNPHVYASGDVSASKGLQLTPVASIEAEIVTQNILEGNHKKTVYFPTATVVFTMPTMASVGYTEQQANAKHLDFDVKYKSVPELFSAKSVNAQVYAYKIIFDKTNHKILGAHLVGPHVEETICLFTMAIQAGIKISEIEKILFPYPVSGADIKSMLT